MVICLSNEHTQTWHLILNIFKKFSDRKITNTPFPRITYSDAMLQYGSDKPDLRNPIIIMDMSALFAESEFTVFRDNVKKGLCVRAIPAPRPIKNMMFPIITAKCIEGSCLKG